MIILGEEKTFQILALVAIVGVVALATIFLAVGLQSPAGELLRASKTTTAVNGGGSVTSTGTISKCEVLIVEQYRGKGSNGNEICKNLGYTYCSFMEHHSSINYLSSTDRSCTGLIQATIGSTDIVTCSAGLLPYSTECIQGLGVNISSEPYFGDQLYVIDDPTIICCK